MKSSRSFLNDENAAKKLAVLCIPLVIAVLTFAGIKLADNIKSGVSAGADIAETDINESSNSVMTPALALCDEYKPFECSKSDYLYFGQTVKYHSAYFCRSVNGDALLYKNLNTGAEKYLFAVSDSEDKSFRICAYIKNSVYFGIDDALYKLEIDENGDYNESSLSRVINLPAVPAYIEENKMVLTVSGEQGDFYVLLDTLTGEYERTDDYNILISDVPKGLISENTAAQSAYNRANDDYAAYIHNELQVTNAELIYKPVFENFDGSEQAENLPEYCWKIYLYSPPSQDGGLDEASFAVYINAENENVVCIDAGIYD